MTTYLLVKFIGKNLLCQSEISHQAPEKLHIKIVKCTENCAKTHAFTVCRKCRTFLITINNKACDHIHNDGKVNCFLGILCYVQSFFFYILMVIKLKFKIIHCSSKSEKIITIENIFLHLSRTKLQANI